MLLRLQQRSTLSLLDSCLSDCCLLRLLDIHSFSKCLLITDYEHKGKKKLYLSRIHMKVRKIIIVYVQVPVYKIIIPGEPRNRDTYAS